MRKAGGGLSGCGLRQRAPGHWDRADEERLPEVRRGATRGRRRDGNKPVMIQKCHAYSEYTPKMLFES